MLAQHDVRYLREDLKGMLREMFDGFGPIDLSRTLGTQWRTPLASRTVASHASVGGWNLLPTASSSLSRVARFARMWPFLAQRGEHSLRSGPRWHDDPTERAGPDCWPQDIARHVIQYNTLLLRLLFSCHFVATATAAWSTFGRAVSSWIVRTLSPTDPHRLQTRRLRFRPWTASTVINAFHSKCSRLLLFLEADRLQWRVVRRSCSRRIACESLFWELRSA